MKQKTEERKITVSRRPVRDPVRLTALLYLKEALLAEKYEECAEIITIARQVGAREGEIAGLLEEPRRQLDLI